MMRPFIATSAILILCGAGCQKPPPKAAAAAKPPPAIAPPPLTMKVKQRSTTAVPGSNGRISLTIDDITRGQVIASLVGEAQQMLVGPSGSLSGE